MPARASDARLVSEAYRFGRNELTFVKRRTELLRAAGHSHEEIAELTGDTHRTVKRQLGQAQGKLRDTRGPGDAAP